MRSAPWTKACFVMTCWTLSSKQSWRAASIGQNWMRMPAISSSRNFCLRSSPTTTAVCLRRGHECCSGFPDSSVRWRLPPPPWQNRSHPAVFAPWARNFPLAPGSCCPPFPSQDRMVRNCSFPVRSTGWIPLRRKILSIRWWIISEAAETSIIPRSMRVLPCSCPSISRLQLPPYGDVRRHVLFPGAGSCGGRAGEQP